MTKAEPQCLSVRQEEPAYGTPKGSNVQSFLLHSRLLGTRLYIHALVRFIVVGCMIGGAFFAQDVVGIEGLSVSSLALLGILLGLYNIVIFAVVRRYYQDTEATASSYPFLTRLMHTTIAADFVFLTTALWLVGGAKSPFKAFYVIHVIIAVILLSPRAAFAHALFGFLLLTGLVVGQWLGWIPVLMPLGAVNSTAPLDGRYVITVLVVQGMLMALTLFLLTGLVHLLRSGEQRLRTANTELERLSEMHRAFLHIAIHDLKAPVSAATMLLDTLETGGQSPLTDEQRLIMGRVHARLEEVTAFLRDFEVLAALETASIEKHGSAVDISALVQEVAAENTDLAKLHGHTLSVELKEALPQVYGIERLIHEAVANLITNAIKYTPDGGSIMVRGLPCNGYVCVAVEDNGVGIRPEDQGRLFQEFVRIRRAEQASAKMLSSGLGLSIVKRIIEAHGGKVEVDSEPNKGSIFTIRLPLDAGRSTARN